MDSMHAENSKFCYPACKAPSCRSRTITQRAERDKAMNMESNAPMVKPLMLPPPPPLSHWESSASSSSAAAVSSPHVPAPVTAAATSSVDISELLETVTSMQNEVKIVSQKMDLVMDILEALRLKVCLSQLESTPFQ
jgi:hypothetical protein